MREPTEEEWKLMPKLESWVDPVAEVPTFTLVCLDAGGVATPNQAIESQDGKRIASLSLNLRDWQVQLGGETCDVSINRERWRVTISRNGFRASCQFGSNLSLDINGHDFEGTPFGSGFRIKSKSKKVRYEFRPAWKDAEQFSGVRHHAAAFGEEADPMEAAAAYIVIRISESLSGDSVG